MFQLKKGEPIRTYKEINGLYEADWKHICNLVYDYLQKDSHIYDRNSPNFFLTCMLDGMRRQEMGERSNEAYIHFRPENIELGYLLINWLTQPQNYPNIGYNRWLKKNDLYTPTQFQQIVKQFNNQQDINKYHDLLNQQQETYSYMFHYNPEMQLYEMYKLTDVFELYMREGIYQQTDFYQDVINTVKSNYGYYLKQRFRENNCSDRPPIKPNNGRER